MIQNSLNIECLEQDSSPSIFDYFMIYVVEPVLKDIFCDWNVMYKTF